MFWQCWDCCGFERGLMPLFLFCDVRILAYDLWTIEESINESRTKEERVYYEKTQIMEI